MKKIKVNKVKVIKVSVLDKINQEVSQMKNELLLRSLGR